MWVGLIWLRIWVCFVLFRKRLHKMWEIPGQYGKLWRGVGWLVGWLVNSKLKKKTALNIQYLF